nr:CUB and sushi domain-containing protein 3-like [Lytechinus pictus]
MTLVLRCTTTLHTTNCMFTPYTTKFQAFVVYHKPGATNCSAPSIPAHAHLTDRRLNYNYGDRITVTCNTSSDTFTIQCHNKGLWSGPQISCPAPAYAVEPVRCNSPYIPRYGSIDNLRLDYNIGASVRITCDRNTDSYSLRCNSDGFWTGSVLSCPAPVEAPEKCSAPYVPMYATIQDLRMSYDFNERISVTCDNSTTQFTLRCDVHGLWSGSVVSCPEPYSTPEKCSAPYVPRYATIQGLQISYDFNERISVTCDNSTTQFTLRCDVHGLWSGSVVSCPEPYRPPVQCSAPYVPRYATIQDLRMSYDFNERITVTCDNSTTQFSLRCHTHGLWSGPVVSCPEPYRPPTRCNAPSIPRYSSVRNRQASYNLGARVNVRCDNSSVRFALRCRTGGLWEGQPIRCNSPYIPRHGSIDNLRLDYSIGASVRITCDSSTDSYNLQCNSDGFWTGSVLSCPAPIEAPEKCSAPYVPRYATIQGLQISYDFNERITVTCDNSSTQFALQCDVHGLWSGPVVSCPEHYRQPVRCNSPYIPRYGSIDNLRLDYNVGDSVRITCDSSTDSYNLRCNSDGYWTGSVFSCPAPIEVVNGIAMARESAEELDAACVSGSLFHIGMTGEETKAIANSLVCREVGGKEVDA